MNDAITDKQANDKLCPMRGSPFPPCRGSGAQPHALDRRRVSERLARIQEGAPMSWPEAFNNVGIALAIAIVFWALLK